MRAIRLGPRRVGPSHPCFIIAEAGVNHDGNLEIARRLVDVAAEAGADAVKFQTFSADRLTTADAPMAEYQKAGTGAGKSQWDMLRRLELPAEAHQDLAARAAERGLVFLSTPFDEESADFLDTLGVPAFKVASGEITNTPFLAHLARKGKPLLVSTGMATLEEVRQAVNIIRGTSNSELALLQCVSAYPAAAADVNLRAMATLEHNFDVPVGYSDHTLGSEVALAAVALGACVLEKHFTLDRRRPGPDHLASTEPDELKVLVRAIRNVEAALGHGRKEPVQSEMDAAAVARKSLVTARNLSAGEVLRCEDIVIRRPGSGMPPTDLVRVVGRTLRRSIRCGSLLKPSDLEGL